MTVERHGADGRDEGLPAVNAPVVGEGPAAALVGGIVGGVGPAAAAGDRQPPGIKAEPGGVTRIQGGEHGPHGKRPGLQIGVADRRFVLLNVNPAILRIPSHALVEELRDITGRDQGAAVGGVWSYVHLNGLAVHCGGGLIQGHDYLDACPGHHDLAGLLHPLHICAQVLRQRADGDHRAVIADFWLCRGYAPHVVPCKELMSVQIEGHSVLIGMDGLGDLFAVPVAHLIHIGRIVEVGQRQAEGGEVPVQGYGQIGTVVEIIEQGRAIRPEAQGVINRVQLVSVLVLPVAGSRAEGAVGGVVGPLGPGGIRGVLGIPQPQKSGLIAHARGGVGHLCARVGKLGPGLGLGAQREHLGPVLRLVDLVSGEHHIVFFRDPARRCGRVRRRKGGGQQSTQADQRGDKRIQTPSH